MYIYKNMKTTIKNLQLKTLLESAGNPQKMSDKVFTGLVDSIKRKGWYFAVPDVWEFEPGKYRIISGHHRIKAGMKAGLIEQNCNVIIDPSYNEEQARKDLLESNERHGDPDQDLFVDFVTDIIDDFNVDLDILADEVGFDESIITGILFDENINEKEMDEDIEIKHECPKCGYKWS